MNNLHKISIDVVNIKTLRQYNGDSSLFLKSDLIKFNNFIKDHKIKKDFIKLLRLINHSDLKKLINSINFLRYIEEDVYKQSFVLPIFYISFIEGFFRKGKYLDFRTWLKTKTIKKRLSEIFINLGKEQILDKFAELEDEYLNIHGITNTVVNAIVQYFEDNDKKKLLRNILLKDKKVCFDANKCLKNNVMKCKKDCPLNNKDFLDKQIKPLIRIIYDMRSHIIHNCKCLFLFHPSKKGKGWVAILSSTGKGQDFEPHISSSEFKKMALKAVVNFLNIKYQISN